MKRHKDRLLYSLRCAVIAVSYFLVEIFAVNFLETKNMMCLAFSGAWAILFTCMVLFLPSVAGHIFYIITYTYSLPGPLH